MMSFCKIGVPLVRIGATACEVRVAAVRPAAVGVLVRTMGTGLDEAVEKLNLLPSASNDLKLELYGLFKQATVGPNDTPQPGMMQMVSRAKWNAWSEHGDLSKEDAEAKYIARVELALQEAGVKGGEDAAGVKDEASAAAPGERVAIQVSVEGGGFHITLNRPDRFNAFNLDMYNEVIDALKEAGEDPSVKFATLTGNGKYFSSGNDLAMFTNIPPEGPKKLAKDAGVLCRAFVESFIRFPKPLIAGVNGPAFGIATTLLGLCDIVYASNTATFTTPFAKLGQSPEGCSSVTFPKIMGTSRANQMLLLGRPMTAFEAKEVGFVADVFESTEFTEELKKVVDTIGALPPQSLALTKQLGRNHDIDELLAVNDREVDLLEERWLSDECMAAIMQFMSRKE